MVGFVGLASDMESLNFDSPTAILGYWLPYSALARRVASQPERVGSRLASLNIRPANNGKRQDTPV